MLTIDGAQGEGGGQLLRTSLALSLLTGRPFRMIRIRAGRPRPGLMRQHLTAVLASAQISDAQVEGADVGSQELTFTPRQVRPGSYAFSIGTAGSATLVLQTVLPALLHASGPSTLTLEGGTHNPMAPPFDFLERVFLPQIARMGAHVRLRLERPGFFPAGGGLFTAEITPAAGGRLLPLELLDRGAIVRRHARAVVAHLPRHVGERELALVRSQLGWSDAETELVEAPDSRGPGNVLLIETQCEHVTELFTAFGSPKVSAEAVGGEAVSEARRYLAANVPVGEYLADQLLLPLALAGGGSFRTLPLSSHAHTQLALLRQFIGAEVEVSAPHDGTCVVTMRKGL